MEVLRLPRDAHDPARRRRDTEHVDERELPVVEERLPDDRAALAEHEQSVQSGGRGLAPEAAARPFDEIQHVIEPKINDAAGASGGATQKS